MASFHELVLSMTLDCTAHESRALIGLAAVEAVKQVWSWRIAAKDASYFKLQSLVAFRSDLAAV
eukprot:511963-Amphidinium_carterae.2